MKKIIWIGLFALVLGLSATMALYIHLERYPGELMRYAEKRLRGHNKLEFVILPIFDLVRPYIEKPVGEVYRIVGIGHQQERLPPQTYNAEGRPIPSLEDGGIRSILAPLATIHVTTVNGLTKAMKRAEAGDVIELAPGHYQLKRNLITAHGGTRVKPIVVRGAAPGAVVIESSAMEGFHVTKPYWIFEDLIIKGVCGRHYDCEHAFHVAGSGRNTVIRNNEVIDFNAQIKVNGWPTKNAWPDGGLIQYNTLRNTSGRDTHQPVTPVDMVAVDGWRVADNYIGHFVKRDGNRVSYGVFMKGAGNGGIIERNQIVCTEQDVSQVGVRVGLSFGGGGTNIQSCRRDRCAHEFTRGLARSNVIQHCNDVGIYVNHSNEISIINNTLINTYGMDFRYPQTTVYIQDNTMDGRVRFREGATQLSKPPDQSALRDDGGQ